MRRIGKLVLTYVEGAGGGGGGGGEDRVKPGSKGGKGGKGKDKREVGGGSDSAIQAVQNFETSAIGAVGQQGFEVNPYSSSILADRPTLSPDVADDVSTIEHIVCLSNSARLFVLTSTSCDFSGCCGGTSPNRRTCGSPAQVVSTYLCAHLQPNPPNRPPNPSYSLLIPPTPSYTLYTHYTH